MDRRRFTRANFHAITRYTCPSGDSLVEIQMRISDISEGGVLMVTCMKMPPGYFDQNKFCDPQRQEPSRGRRG